MNYEIINTETWERGELFRFYIEKLRNVMSMTVDTDVTKLVSFVRAHGLKFYPAMMWAVSKAVNGRAEFRYGWKNGDLVRWDYVSPYYADFHGEDFDISCLPWVRYRSFDIHVFDEGRYLAPVVTWGRFETENGKTVLPLSVNIHHAVADGWHLSRLFADVQEIINTL